MTLAADMSHHNALRSVEFGANAVRYENTKLATIEELIEVEAFHQPLLARDVLVKRLTAEGNALLRVRRAFLQEIRSTAALRHPLVAQIYEASNGTEMPYAVFEHVAGTNLRAAIDTRYDNGHAFGAAEATRIVAAVAGVVEYANAQGTRVFDLRPSNIVLAEGDTVVLQSLGMAPVEIERLSAEQMAYLAPEYVAGVVADERAEVYALGALLVHLLTGTAPFEGSASAIAAQKERAAQAPRLFAQNVAADARALLQVARAALHPNMRERPATVQAFREALTGSPTTKAPAELSPVVPVIAAPIAAPVAVEEAIDTFVMPAMGDALLIPGMERPEFTAALPFTILVPLPAALAEAQASPVAAAPARPAMGLSQQLWLVLLVALMVSVGAAMMLG